MLLESFNKLYKQRFDSVLGFGAGGGDRCCLVAPPVADMGTPNTVQNCGPRSLCYNETQQAECPFIVIRRTSEN